MKLPRLPLGFAIARQPKAAVPTSSVSFPKILVLPVKVKTPTLSEKRDKGGATLNVVSLAFQ